MWAERPVSWSAEHHWRMTHLALWGRPEWHALHQLDSIDSMSKMLCVKVRMVRMRKNLCDPQMNEFRWLLKGQVSLKYHQVSSNFGAAGSWFTVSNSVFAENLSRSVLCRGFKGAKGCKRSRSLMESAQSAPFETMPNRLAHAHQPSPGMVWVCKLIRCYCSVHPESSKKEKHICLDGSFIFPMKQKSSRFSLSDGFGREVWWLQLPKDTTTWH